MLRSQIDGTIHQFPNVGQPHPIFTNEHLAVVTALYLSQTGFQGTVHADGLFPLAMQDRHLMTQIAQLTDHSVIRAKGACMVYGKDHLHGIILNLLKF
jgi:hypothetical protein